MENSERYFANTGCPHFPCHEGADPNNFNCMFCYCPLFHYKNCGGNYTMLENGWKDCSKCVRPHTDYDWVIGRLTKLSG